MVDKLECDELEKWATVSWAIWTARNRFYFEKTQWHPKRILGEALGYLKAKLHGHGHGHGHDTDTDTGIRQFLKN